MYIITDYRLVFYTLNSIFNMYNPDKFLFKTKSKYMKGRIINNQHNNCWFWSSVRIMKEYIKINGIPKELSNEYIKRSISGEDVIIEKYNEETFKQGDLDNALNGNAVEFLVVNGFYHDSCLSANSLPPDNNAFLKFTEEIPFAFLIQYPGHYSCVIREEDKFIMYDAIGDKEFATKLNYDENQRILAIPRNIQHTLVYTYNKKI